jgi:hypothetical protein
VTFDIILLALGNMVRPTSLAAVYALLSGQEPRRMMVAYVISGLVATIAFGVLVLLAFDGITVNHGGSTARGIAQLGGGVLVLGFGRLVWTGHIAVPGSSDAPDVPSRWRRMLDGRLTLKTAVLAGPLTHVPGIFYLAALNIIAAHNLGPADEVLEVLLYNAIWFALPIGALAICIVRPSTARDVIAAINTWARDHSRGILTSVSVVIGVVLLVRATITL